MPLFPDGNRSSAQDTLPSPHGNRLPAPDTLPSSSTATGYPHRAPCLPRIATCCSHRTPCLLPARQPATHTGHLTFTARQPAAHTGHLTFTARQPAAPTGHPPSPTDRKAASQGSTARQHRRTASQDSSGRQHSKAASRRPIPGQKQARGHKPRASVFAVGRQRIGTSIISTFASVPPLMRNSSASETPMPSRGPSSSPATSTFPSITKT